MMKSRTHRGAIETYQQSNSEQFTNESASKSADFSSMGSSTLAKTRFGAKEQIVNSISPNYDPLQERYALFSYDT